jgi:hypothetical protein
LCGRKIFIGTGILYCLAVSGFSDPFSLECPRVRAGTGDTIHGSVDTAGKHACRYEFDYSLLFSNFLFLNWVHEKNADQAGFLQNLKYHLDIDRTPVFKLSGTFTHNLGLLYYFDSITKVQTDNNTLAIDAKLFQGKRFHLVFGSVLETQLLNGYRHASVNGTNDRTRISSFLTPLVCTFSLGGGIDWKSFGSLDFGVSSFKLTWLRDRLIARRYAEDLYGIPPGKNKKTEFGVSLHFLADHEIFHGIRWSCDLLIFRNYKKPTDVTFKNLFGIRINKFLKTNFQTRILYEEQVSDHLQVENLISFGFYFHH